MPTGVWHRRGIRQEGLEHTVFMHHCRTMDEIRTRSLSQYFTFSNYRRLKLLMLMALMPKKYAQICVNRFISFHFLFTVQYLKLKGHWSAAASKHWQAPNQNRANEKGSIGHHDGPYISVLPLWPGHLLAPPAPRLCSWNAGISLGISTG